MRTSLMLLAISTLAISTVALADKEYTLAELQSLAQREEWQEVLEHASDVHTRNDAWDQVVLKAANGFLGSVASKKDLLSALPQFLTGLELKYPTLLKQKSYRAKRAEVGILGYETCMEGYSAEECVKGLNGFLDGDRDNSALMVDAAKMVRKHNNAQFAAPFWNRAVGSKRSAVCKEAGLLEADIAALDRLPPEYDANKAAMATLKTCWDDLKGPIVKEFEKYSSNFLTSTCPFLIAQHAIAKDQEHWCKKKE